MKKWMILGFMLVSAPCFAEQREDNGQPSRQIVQVGDLTQQDRISMQTQQLISSYQYGQANKKNREVYSQIFGEKVSWWNPNQPLSDLERQRLEYYFQTGRDLWRKNQ
jgi:hypothetical protein